MARRGSARCYEVDGCTHPECREASRRRHRDSKASRAQRRSWVTDSSHPHGGYWKSPQPDEQHGRNAWLYSNWLCHCPPCTAANTEHSARHRQKKPVPAG